MLKLRLPSFHPGSYRNSRFCLGASLALGLALSLVSGRAEATVTIISALGASGFSSTGTAPTTGTATPVTTTGTVTVYGGVAGIGSSGQVSIGNGQYDTCANPQTPFMPCNNAAISPQAILTVSFQSDSVDGVPSITYVAEGSASGTTLGYVGGIPASVTHGGPAAVSVTWESICAVMSAAVGTVDTSCNLVTPGTPATYTFTATITGTTASTGTTTGSNTSTTDTGSFTVTIADGPGTSLTTASTVAPCDPNTPSNDTGICHFEMGSGDSRVELKTLYGTSLFPNLNTVPIGQIVLMWAPGKDTFQQIQSPTLANLNSDHKLITVETDSSGNITLDQSKIDGFTNDTFYSFKIGLVDLAGNMAYFTANGDDTAKTGADYSCIFTSNPTGTECHVAEPGEVEGVLTKEVNCFVATAAYGSAMAPQVETFRQFRNAYLITSHWGRKFVHFYYRHSPKYAHIIAHYPFLRAMARAGLWPLLGFAHLSLRIGALNALLLVLGSGILLTLLGAYALSRRGGRV